MLFPVILSGGAGTRLWPVSREGHPKPFMALPDGESLLLKTYRRAGALLADGSYYLLGFSVWWCVAAAVRAWLAGLARWLRVGRDETAPPPLDDPADHALILKEFRILAAIERSAAPLMRWGFLCVAQVLRRAAPVPRPSRPPAPPCGRSR